MQASLDSGCRPGVIVQILRAHALLLAQTFQCKRLRDCQRLLRRNVDGRRDSDAFPVAVADGMERTAEGNAQHEVGRDRDKLVVVGGADCSTSNQLSELELLHIVCKCLGGRGRAAVDEHVQRHACQSAGWQVLQRSRLFRRLGAFEETHFQDIAAHEMADQVTNRRMRAAAIASEIDDRSVAALEKSHGVVVGGACFILDPFEAGDFQIADVAAKDLRLREAVMVAKRLPPP